MFPFGWPVEYGYPVQVGVHERILSKQTYSLSQLVRNGIFSCDARPNHPEPWEAAVLTGAWVKKRERESALYPTGSNSGTPHYVSQYWWLVWLTCLPLYTK